MPCKEEGEEVEFVAQAALMTDVLEVFHSHEARGEELAAVLITQSGKATEKLLGVITLADILALLRNIEV